MFALIFYLIPSMYGFAFLLTYTCCIIPVILNIIFCVGRLTHRYFFNVIYMKCQMTEFTLDYGGIKAIVVCVIATPNIT